MATASAMSAASARTRSDSRPSGSPIMNVARLPRSATPGSVVAPKLTTASTTRSGPTAAARIGVVRPFCRLTANPPPCHPARQQRGGRRRVVRLDRHRHRAVEPVRQIAGRHYRHPGGEGLHRPLDPQPARADRLDDGWLGVAGQHVVAVPHQSGGHGAAHRAAAKHHVPHGG